MTTLLFFDELESTSTQAMTLLRQDAQTVPFAVQALRQVGGRGRLGQSWQSPEGNLYLSVVLPLSPDIVTTIPLRAAVLVAAWIKDFFGIGVTLKWPNDVLFAGAKLAGILCETQAPGGKLAGSCVVGIGININVAPTLATPYPKAVALADILERPITDSLKQLGQSLADFLVRHWMHLDSAQIFARWDSLAIPQQQVWSSISTPGDHRFDAGLSEQGNLQLRTAKSEMLTLSSAEHNWRWSLMRAAHGNGQQLAIIEIGHSSVKMGWVGCTTPLVFKSFDRVTYDASAAVTCERWYKLWQSNGFTPDVVHVAIVAESRSGEWLQALSELRCEIALVRKRWLRCPKSLYVEKQLGLDRFAAIESAYLESWESSAVKILVSAGTALTVDVITKEQHLGGYIVPGISFAARQLRAAAPGLPLVVAKAQKEWPTMTTEAIAAGIVREKTAFIADVARQITSDLNLAAAPKVIVSGGDRFVLGEALPAAEVRDTDFLFRGYVALILGGLLTVDVCTATNHAAQAY